MPVPFFTAENTEKFRNLVSDKKRIAIVTHVNPDGDAIGTSLALAQCLRAIGKEPVVVVPNPFPAFLHWLNGAKEILIYKHAEEKVKAALANIELVMCTDFNNIDRLGDLGKLLAGVNAPFVLIDHHPQPAEHEFTLCFSAPEACSSAEIAYQLIKEMGWAKNISIPSAEAIYTGIMTDTNNFLNNCNNPLTFRTVAELLEFGIDKEKIHEAVYNNYSESRMRLLGYALSEKMVVLPEYCTAYIALSSAELEQFNFQAGDTEGFVNCPLSIKNIVFSAFISENPENTRLSFRSRGSFSVNDFARENFDGGGHLNAAGGNSSLSLNETIEKFVKSLEKYKNALVAI